MIKPDDPRELAIDLLDRSTCMIQVAAVIADRWGIFSWGHNHVGFDGFGCHAEKEAIRRANKVRLTNRATIYVASRRQRNLKTICSKPCMDCGYLIGKYGLKICWRDANGKWEDIG